MAQLTSPARTHRQATRRPKVRWWRGAVLLIAGVYFVIPLAASAWFSIDEPKGISFEAYTGLLSAPGFLDSLWLTLGLALATVLVLLLLLVPALIAVRLGAPRLRPVIDVLCTLPLVVPPVALTAGTIGVLRWGPDYLMDTPFFQTFVFIQDPDFPLVLVIAYVLMALPLAYRSLDAGLRAVDVRTLVEAARNCGASWPRAVFTVVLPNLRGALLNASFLTLALVLGEFTAASILGYQPFPVWIYSVGNSQAHMSVAVSILSLLLTWLLLLLLAGLSRQRGSKTATS
ncbi:ABC transporter permease subunit [Kitasatospora purpeofusca]|uniref:ABC transporter permease n=1 Tax=Kitasatospora purpeofusca TaxID=67352 RepID=UPI000A64B500|nr:ABC transporter permease subunit [Kitasatospora purpeofusca]MCX4757405.1 ABC transporter permease subunit [Kitasatospora purpeofusca]WSR34858.1 ABC transporter permease subunit [Kitasatospora purpeofusca]WSR43076.1 ABC transporter permease subunit [Kitasatospora purpeofusca]